MKIKTITLQSIQCVFLLLFSTHVFAQSIFTKNYYLFPIKPNQQAWLAGSMGEIRSNHFHSGLDIKVGGQIGWPVYAAQEGYVERIKMSNYGYGRAVYIKHPNGETTVYAHLHTFDKKIADYLLKEQYKAEKYELDVYPPKNAIMYKKRDIIGKAGSSGSSSGPHLHFEIRNKDEEPLNPLGFGFKEIKDNIPPVITGVKIAPLNINSRINGNFSPKYLAPARSGNNYSIPKIQAIGQIGVSINIHDRADQTHNKNGVSKMELFVNDVSQFTSKIEKFSFSKTRHLNVHVDFEDYNLKRKPYQKCYIEDGNELDFYSSNENKGKISISDARRYQIKVVLTDWHNNKSILKFEVIGNKLKLPNSPIKIKDWNHTISKNTLKINAIESSNSKPLIVYCKGKETIIKKAYKNGTESVYLYDLRKGLPDSICIKNSIKKLPYNAIIPSGVDTSYSSKYIDINFPNKTLFDTLYLSAQYNANNYKIANYSIPLASYINITLKPKNLKNIHQYRVYSYNKNNRASFTGGVWKDGKITFKTKTFGRYTLKKDVTPPSIKFVSKSSKYIKLIAKDNLSGIKSYHATINGEFLLLEYHSRTGVLISDRLDKTKPLKGKFVLKVRDGHDNEKTFTTTF